MKRRNFLLLACLAGTPVWAQKNRSYASARYGLELDGQFVGWLKSVEGGTPSASVIAERAGGLTFPKKHLGAVRYEPLTFEASLESLPALAEWLRTMTQGKARRNGAILLVDFNYKVVGRLEFVNALLTEFSLPELNATSKDAGYFRVTVAPEQTRLVEGKGTAASPLGAKGKNWIAANFRLTIPGLDCSRVTRLGAISVRQRANASAVGDAREYLKEPGQLEVSDFTVTLAESAADPFQDWVQDFVLKGNSGESQEKDVKLELLDPGLKETLATVVLRHVGIAGQLPTKATTNADSLPTATFQLYTETIEVIPGGK